MKQQVRIASPCSADWDRMSGNERVRYCPECKLDVYNFSELTRAEVERIVLQRDGRLCARFYQRPDGAMITRNSPVKFRVAIQRISRVASAALAAAMSVAPAMAAPTLMKQDPGLLQIQPAQSVLALQVVDITGAVVANAPVTITNEKTGRKIAGETDTSGQLRLVDLPSGTYEITVIVLGFQTLKLPNIAVPARDPLKLQLEVAALMGEVVSFYQEPERTPISALLTEPSPATSNAAGSSHRHPNALQKFLSALRHMF